MRLALRRNLITRLFLPTDRLSIPLRYADIAAMYTLSVEGARLASKRSYKKDRITSAGQFNGSSIHELHQIPSTCEHTGVL